MRSFKQIIPFLIFHILLWFSNLTGAVPAGTKNNPEFPTYHKNTGSKVGVELDWQLAKAGPEDVLPGKPAAAPKLGPRLVFMAHWTVPANTISDVQLAQICIDGYDDMVKSAEQYKFHPANYPTVVTAFLTGTDLIIASSQKGGVALTYTKDNGVGLLVDECLKNPDDGTTSVKSNGGKCGEMSAAQIWQRLHPGKPIAAAKILTVSVKKKDGEVIVWAPCTEGAKVRFPLRPVQEVYDVVALAKIILIRITGRRLRQTCWKR
ncbi:hypothetical protein P171DRAFT_227678 [Karstenula rhodostoma CBS 690.94]|uniref:Uncharacterized protein n=1 Tax=Karstenula rhodostoma CBS 690.94 TaxID=1392251 RepID=A0A9P4UEL4_9PLEO|nr:hypothetical protein P171DRAFT_227678 [Karstenula rhodostoma CBS 690.94]